MKFGLKLWSKNKDLIGEACKLINENFFHYVELFYVPGTEIKPFLDHNIPYIIHNSTERFGVNIGDKTKKEFNLKIINTCINWANKLNAKYIIQHADYGSFEDAKNLLKEVHDERIVIENMPNAGINGEKMIGFLVDNLRFVGINLKHGWVSSDQNNLVAKSMLKIRVEQISYVYWLSLGLVVGKIYGKFNQTRKDK